MKYTVQRQIPKTDSSGNLEPVWFDIATVEVEPRTTRRTVIKRALADAGIKPDEGPLRLRVLDEESAAVFEPEGVQPPMEWKV
jgi:hypothetical protein